MTFIKIDSRPTNDLIKKYGLQEITEADRTDFKLYLRSIKGDLRNELISDYPELAEIENLFDLRAIKFSVYHSVV